MSSVFVLGDTSVRDGPVIVSTNVDTSDIAEVSPLGSPKIDPTTCSSSFGELLTCRSKFVAFIHSADKNSTPMVVVIGGPHHVGPCCTNTLSWSWVITIRNPAMIAATDVNSANIIEIGPASSVREFSHNGCFFHRSSLTFCLLSFKKNVEK